LVAATTEIRARTGTLSTPWSANSSLEFVPPELKYIDDKLDDICDQRAIEIFQISRSQNKKIAVMWSGGIDSTTILSAFLKNVGASDLDNFVIFLSTSSIIENPIFYQKFIANKIRCESIYDLDITNEFLDQYIVVHGDPGDCIFGPSVFIFKDLLHDKKHCQSWKSNQDLIVNNMIGSIQYPLDPDTIKGFVNWYVDKISNNLYEVDPPGVESISDWWWWHYYNFKWEFSISKPLILLRKSHRTPISADRIQSYYNTTFLNTDRFQQWSYSNLKNHIGTSQTDHKMLAKQYIFELDKNLDYFNNKVKTHSHATSELMLKKCPVCYDQNWVGHHWDEVGDTIIELLENYPG
jgi:uncharacterized protein with PIN domain